MRCVVRPCFILMVVGLVLLFTVSNDTENGGLLTVPGAGGEPKLRRSQSRAFLSEDGLPQPIEFFVASDASAVIEHTKRVLYLEDDDIAHISEGGKFRMMRRLNGSLDSRSDELNFFFLDIRAPHPPTAQGRWTIVRASHRNP
jgi:glucosamine 6-phosphate synthetase-like amidotransferase/phosphosugar isomerase protein